MVRGAAAVKISVIPNLKKVMSDNILYIVMRSCDLIIGADRYQSKTIRDP